MPMLDDLALLEEISGLALGDPDGPLLVHAELSDGTALPFVGLTPDTIAAIGEDVRYEDAVWDAYRRLVEAVCVVALDVDPAALAREVYEVKVARGMLADLELTDDDWKEVVARYATLCERLGYEGGFPIDPRVQLKLAEAVAAERGAEVRLRVASLDEVVNPPV